MGVLVAVTCDPHAILGIHGDPVHLLRPFEPSTGTAPAPHDLTIRVELDDRRRRRASGLLDGFSALNDHDVISRIHRDAADGTDAPAVWQRLGPARIDLEG